MIIIKLTNIPVYPLISFKLYSLAYVSNNTTCVSTIDVNAFAKLVIFTVFKIVEILFLYLTIPLIAQEMMIFSINRYNTKQYYKTSY